MFNFVGIDTGTQKILTLDQRKLIFYIWSSTPRCKSWHLVHAEWHENYCWLHFM